MPVAIVRIIIHRGIAQRSNLKLAFCSCLNQRMNFADIESFLETMSPYTSKDETRNNAPEPMFSREG